MSDLGSRGGECEDDHCDVTPCNLVARYRHFGGIFRLILHSIRQDTLHIPEDLHLHAVRTS
jgi:hypothetical protein